MFLQSPMKEILLLLKIEGAWLSLNFARFWSEAKIRKYMYVVSYKRHPALKEGGYDKP